MTAVTSSSTSIPSAEHLAVASNAHLMSAMPRRRRSSLRRHGHLTSPELVALARHELTWLQWGPSRILDVVPALASALLIVAIVTALTGLMWLGAMGSIAAVAWTVGRDRGRTRAVGRLERGIRQWDRRFGSAG